MKAIRALKHLPQSRRAEKARQKDQAQGSPVSSRHDEPQIGEPALLPSNVMSAPHLNSEDMATREYKQVLVAQDWKLEQEWARECLEILYDPDQAPRAHGIQTALPGTCEWLNRHPKVELWLNSRHSTCLWLTAGPGRGKSTIAKYMASHLLNDSQTKPIICQYFSDSSSSQQSASRLLCWLVYQLFKQRPHLLKQWQPEFQEYGKSIAFNTEILWHIWTKSAADPAAGQIVCVIDALDELLEEDRWILTQKFLQFFASVDDASKVKLLVTSRSDEELQDRLDHGGPWARVGHLNCEESLESEAISKAPDVYIENVLREFRLKRKNRHFSNSPLLEEPIARLKATRPPSYLVIRLMVSPLLNGIEKGYSSTKLQNVIQSSPAQLEVFYERNLRQSRDLDLTKRILLIILAASRELTCIELQVALCLGYDDSKIRSFEDLTSDLSLSLDGIDRFEARVLELCGGLIHISSVNDTGEQLHSRTSEGSRETSAGSVPHKPMLAQPEFPQRAIHFSHETAREFLVAPKSYDLFSQDRSSHSTPSSKAHTVLARASIRFLQLLRHQDDQTVAQDAPQLSAVPPWARSCFEYSIDNWMKHLKAAEIEAPGLFNLALSTCDASFINFLQPNLGLCSPPSSGSAPIIAAAYWKLGNLVTPLISQDEACVNAQDEISGMTALMIAAQSGASDIVEALCRVQFLQIDLQNANGDSALIIALESEQEEIAELLLRREADPRIQNGQGITALMTACSSGSTAIVEYLMSREDLGEHINAQNVHGGTALTVAIEGGNTTIVRKLLESPTVDINIVPHGGISQGMTPLMMCAYRGWVNETELLLQRRGLDIQDPDTCHFTALLGKFTRYRDVYLVLESQVPKLSGSMRGEHDTWLREQILSRKYSWLWFLVVEYLDDSEL